MGFIFSAGNEGISFKELRVGLNKYGLLLAESVTVDNSYTSREQLFELG